MELFFHFVTFFANQYFYIIFLCIGYWISRNKRIFIDLIFLVPFSIIINCLLKNIFTTEQYIIPTHLISAHDFLGFPSGDAQTATTLWGIIAINYKAKKYQIFAIVITCLIGFSRVYLGIHSIIDVVGGIVFGIATIIAWQNDNVINIVNDWIDRKTKSFWFLIITTMLLLHFQSPDIPTPPMVVICFGWLIGLGIFLQINKNPAANYANEPIGIILSTILLATYTILIPISSYNIFTTWITIILKYGFIAYSAGTISPKLQTYIYKKVTAIKYKA